MSLKPTIDSLSEGRNINEIAKAYAIAKDGRVPERVDFYRTTVARIIDNPDVRSWESIRLFFAACGIDAEVALAIAASSQIKKSE
jgi:hypothetical protein